MMVSTANDITGFKIVRHLGIVRGITVRSRSVVGNLVGGLQSIFGGQIAAYLELAETSRQEAFDHMCAHATQAGANAVVGMRYDANEIMDRNYRSPRLWHRGVGRAARGMTGNSRNR